MTTIFETRVIAIGSEAKHMITEAGMFILFGEGAPSDLADFCFTIDNKNLTGVIAAGDCLVIDGERYPVTAVGSVVNQNLANLGHITVNLDGAVQANLPGTLHVDGEQFPRISEQSVIQIIA